MTTGILSQRISRRYDVSLVSENDRGNAGEFLIIDSENNFQYRVNLKGNVYGDLKVLLTHGSESQFDSNVGGIVLAEDRKALEGARN